MSLITFTNDESPRLFISAKKQYEMNIGKTLSNSEFLKTMIDITLGCEVHPNSQEDLIYRLVDCENSIKDLQHSFFNLVIKFVNK